MPPPRKGPHAEADIAEAAGGVGTHPDEFNESSIDYLQSLARTARMEAATCSASFTQSDGL